MTRVPLRARSRVRAAALGPLLVVALLLAGCVTVPTSGRIERLEGQQQSCQNCVTVEVAPPSPGDDPQQIVDGFLRANANYQPTYQVARQYLTRESAQSWKPDAKVTVYDGTTAVADDQVTLRGREVGVVASDRAYSASGKTLTLPFTLVRAGRRVADRPAAGRAARGGLRVRAVLLLLRPVLPGQRAAGQRARSPAEPGARARPDLPAQVPEPGQRGLGAGEAAAQRPHGLARCPRSRPRSPRARRSASTPSTITEGVATVALSDTVLTLPDTQRSLLAAQIVYTLKEAVAIRGVAFTVNQQGFRVPESDPTTLVVPTTSISTQLDPVTPNAGNQLYVVRDGKVFSVDDTSGELRPFAGDLGSEPVRSLAVAVTDTDLAAVAAGGTKLVATTTAAAGARARTVLDDVDSLARPQYTRFGELWALGRRNGRQRLWRIVDGRPTAVTAPQLDGRDITAFRFSPDGVRIAFVEQTAKGSLLWVGRVNRGDRVDIEGLRALNIRQDKLPKLVRLKDVSWLDATHLLVLGSATAKEAAGPYAVSEDASTITDQSEPLSWDPVDVAVLLRTQSAIIRSSDGKTWRDQGTTWAPFVDDVQAVAYPG